MNEFILVINAGSSSLKFALFENAPETARVPVLGGNGARLIQ